MKDGTRVVVFDSDGVNPYGSELAQLLTLLSPRVDLATPVDNAFLPHGVRCDSLRPTRSKETVRGAVREAASLAPLAAAIVRGSALPVVVWARTYHKLLLLAATFLRPDAALVYVSHNPGAGRDRPGRFRQRIEQLVLRRAHVVTHTPRLRDAARAAGARNVFVVPHLPYRAYCERFRIRRHHADAESERPISLLLLGALRPDKLTESDIARLRDSLAAGDGRFRLITAVRPRVRVEPVDDRVSVLDLSRDDALDDDAIAAAFAEADALVAPYRNPTDSGTVMLALSAGVPVIAFDGGALRTHLPDASLVPREDWEALRERCATVADLAVPAEWVRDAETEAVEGWRTVLAAARKGRR
jgi:glycosyltransferase involved in cell wall biosynthesis